MLTLEAPAKLNLTLEVLGKRPDGFHEIRSVIQTVNLVDRLHFQPSPGVELKCDMPNWRAEKSLVSRAVKLVQEATGYATGVAIEINKRIPLLSGLGGDSSDAAATLHGLNRLWEPGLSADKMHELAIKLGSDVAFLLSGGTAVVLGRGDRVARLLPLSPMRFVLVVPPVPRLPGKTARLYASLDARHFTNGQITLNLVSSLAMGGSVTLSRLFNVFDSIAFDAYPDLETYWQQFAAAGAREIHLAGSGPALFTVVKDKAEAERIYQKLSSAGLECYLVQNLNIADSRR